MAAATWPWGSDRVTVTAGVPWAGARISPRSAASTVSTMWSGSFDRFARVSCLTLPSSR